MLDKTLRIIYAHDYDITDNDTVWEGLTDEIPELKERLQTIINIIDEGEKHNI